MALKTLLVAFSTTRDVEGTPTRVRFKSQSVVDLTDAEMGELERLTKATGKLHFREPIKEGGNVVADTPEVVTVPDYSGQDVPIEQKSVDQLKAYLDFHGVEYAAGDKKADLLSAARAKEAGQSDDGDPDSGL